MIFRIGGKDEKGCYSGPIERGLPSGIGVIRFESGDLYMGELEKGEMHGRGTLVFEKQMLIGEFEHNLFVL